MNAIKRLFLILPFVLLLSAAACFADAGYSKSQCATSRDGNLQALKSAIRQDLRVRASFAYGHNHFMLRDAIARLRDSTDSFQFPTDPNMSRQSFRDLVGQMQKVYTFYRTCGKECDKAPSEYISHQSGYNLGNFLNDHVLPKQAKSSDSAHISFSHQIVDQEVTERFAAWGPHFYTGNWDEDCFKFNSCGYIIVRDYPKTAVDGNFLTYCQRYSVDRLAGNLNQGALTYALLGGANPTQTDICSRVNLSTLEWQDLPLDVTSYNVSMMKNGDVASKPTNLELFVMNERTPECPKVTCEYQVINDVYLTCKP